MRFSSVLFVRLPSFDVSGDDHEKVAHPVVSNEIIVCLPYTSLQKIEREIGYSRNKFPSLIIVFPTMFSMLVLLFSRQKKHLSHLSNHALRTISSSWPCGLRCLWS